MGPSCRFRGQILGHLPGRAGRRPPSASLASPMRAAALWNPKAIRVMTLILVFTDSIRPLLSPWSRGAWMLYRWRRIFSPSSVNSGMRQRAAEGRGHVGEFDHAAVGVAWWIWMMAGPSWRVLAASPGFLTR